MKETRPNQAATGKSKLNGLLDDLGLDSRQVPQVWQRAADLVLDSSDGQDRPALPILDPDRLLEYNALLGFDPACFATLVQAAALIRADSSLERLFRVCTWSLYQSGLNPGQEAFKVPEPQKSMAGLAGLFPVLILLAGLPAMIAFYDEHRIPRDILVATLGDMKIWMGDYVHKNGRYGISAFWWLHRHLSCAIFRIGRLQFIHNQFAGPVKAYRNKESRQVCALSLQGITYRIDGQVDGTNGIFDRQNAWTSSLLEQDGRVSGSPVCPRGTALKPEMALPRDHWLQVLAPGDGVLDIHIPEDGRLDHAACGQSINQAIRFYQSCFPGLEVKAVTCATWLLDPQLQDILDAGANICRFQREVYLYPIRSDDRQIFERVFHTTPDEVRRLKADSKLQKAIIKYVRAGNRLHEAGMFLLAEDAAGWGSHAGPAYADCAMSPQIDQNTRVKQLQGL